MDRLVAIAEYGSPKTSYKLIADLERLGILCETTGRKREKQYIFEDYVKLFQ